MSFPAFDIQKAKVALKTVSREIIPNYNTWVNSGTLLGIHRDGGLIPHDTDIDFGITFHIDHKEKVKNFKYEIFREWDYNGFPMQRAYIVNDTIVDFYYFWRGIEEGKLINVNDHGVWRLDFSLVIPTKMTIWNNVRIDMPNKVEEYLEWHYGDWKIPRKSKQEWWKDAKNLENKNILKGIGF
jgi:hypothetical protein